MTIQDKPCSTRLHLINNQRQCQHCQADKLCLSFGLDASSSAKFRELIIERGPIKQGEPIYRQGDRFKSLFSLQSGTAKAETVTFDGKQSVIGFLFAGDLAGVDGIGSDTYPTDLIALETSWICEIPYQQLLELCGSVPALQSRFIDRLGLRINQDEQDWKVQSGEPAETRVMRFLHQLYQRQRSNGLDSPRIQLPMPKQDLASFLSLTPESLSRVLSRLQKEGQLVKESTRVLVLQQPPAAEQSCPLRR